MTPPLAHHLATFVLADHPQRLRHSEGVSSRVRELGGSDTLIAAGLVHDIGYGVEPITGQHSIDGAGLLLTLGMIDLAPHVAWHSNAAWEASVRGLEISAPQPSEHDHDVLWIADFTTSPTGERCTLEERIAGIRERYETTSPVIAALDASLPSLRAAAQRLEVSTSS